MLALIPYFRFHTVRETKTNTIGSLFLFFLVFVVEIEMMYIKMIIIPPKNAKVKIKGIHGFEFSIHLISIIDEERIRMAITIMIGDMLTINSIELKSIVFVRNIQNLVYLKF